MNDTTITLNASDPTVKAVLTQIRSDLKGSARYGAYVEAHNVTRENVGEHGKALARLITPETAQTVKNEAGTKVRTKFGNAVQTATKGLRTALGSEDSDEDKPVNLLTRAGLAASFEEVQAAWEAAQN